MRIPQHDDLYADVKSEECLSFPICAKNEYDDIIPTENSSVWSLFGRDFFVESQRAKLSERVFPARKLLREELFWERLFCRVAAREAVRTRFPG